MGFRDRGALGRRENALDENAPQKRSVQRRRGLITEMDFFRGQHIDRRAGAFSVQLLR